MAMTPAVIGATLPMVPWNIEKLWELDLPIRQVPVAELVCRP